MMGAVAFQKGLGAVHAISHPLGAIYGLHHGTTNAVLLPPVLRHNHTAISGRLDALASILGVKGGGVALPGLIGARNARLGLPPDLAAMGVQVQDVPMIVEQALADPSGASNPVPVTGERVRAILDEML